MNATTHLLLLAIALLVLGMMRHPGMGRGFAVVLSLTLAGAAGVAAFFS